MFFSYDIAPTNAEAINPVLPAPIKISGDGNFLVFRPPDIRRFEEMSSPFLMLYMHDYIYGNRRAKCRLMVHKCNFSLIETSYAAGARNY